MTGQGFGISLGFIFVEMWHLPPTLTARLMASVEVAVLLRFVLQPLPSSTKPPTSTFAPSHLIRRCKQTLAGSYPLPQSANPLFQSTCQSTDNCLIQPVKVPYSGNFSPGKKFAKSSAVVQC